MTRKVARLALATASGLLCMLINDNWSPAQRSSVITQADARVGRPATPGSVAGVARRQTRRGAYVGAAAGAAAVGAGAYYGAHGGNGCYQAKNSQGHLVTVCP